MPPDDPRRISFDATLLDELIHLDAEREQLSDRLHTVEKRIEHITALLGDADAPPLVRRMLRLQDAIGHGIDALVAFFLSEEPNRVWTVEQIIAQSSREGFLFTDSGIRGGIKRATDQGLIRRVERGKYRVTEAGLEASR